MTNSITLDIILNELITREGGYVNDPVDKGGPTNFGITQATLAAWVGRPVSAGEVSKMSKETAKAIYTQKFWSGPGIDLLPVSLELRINLLDAAVMSGPGTAIRRFQEVLRSQKMSVSVDGALGPKTYDAAKELEDKIGASKLNDLFVDRRLKAVQDRIAREPSQVRFERGWNKRILKFRSRDIKEFTSFETQPAAKPLSQSKTIIGATAAALGTIGTQALELGTQTQAAATAIQPYSDLHIVIKYAFVILTVVGIGLTVYARLRQRQDKIA